MLHRIHSPECRQNFIPSHLVTRIHGKLCWIFHLKTSFFFTLSSSLSFIGSAKVFYAAIIHALICAHLLVLNKNECAQKRMYSNLPKIKAKMLGKKSFNLKTLQY